MWREELLSQHTAVNSTRVLGPRVILGVGVSRGRGVSPCPVTRVSSVERMFVIYVKLDIHRMVACAPVRTGEEGLVQSA